jgi:predicted nucleic acid-binding protein
MQSVVVDTDVVSFLFKRDSRASLYEAHLTGRDLVISFMTLAELKQWPLQKNWGEIRRRKLDEHIQKFTILHSDNDLCLKWAEVVESGRRRGRAIDSADAWIAATALLFDVGLVTHNRKHFAGVEGLTIISEAAP